MTSAQVTSLIVAAGAGSRMGSGPPKALRSLGGIPLFLHALRAFDASPLVDTHVLVLPPGSDPRPPGSLGLRGRILVAEGGLRRQDSVLAGLEAAARAWGTDDGGAPRLVAVHDAARPFPPPDLIARTIEGARTAGSAIPVVPVSDTVREVGPSEESLRILDRTSLRLAQTPQTARLDWLLEAYRAAGAAGVTVTDEGSALEWTGRRITLVAGSPSNFKITTMGELGMAEMLLSPGTGAAGLRIGYGEDRHPRVPERPFILAGVVLAPDHGPAGHSDGDPLCHALVDAVLGAAGAGTIGEMFPDTDPRWAGSSGPDLLARAAAFIRTRGYSVVNVDAVIIADAPRIVPRADEIRRAVAGALDIAVDRVSVKGKRSEGLGFEGTGAGVSCRATVLLAQAPGS